MPVLINDELNDAGVSSDAIAAAVAAALPKPAAAAEVAAAVAAALPPNATPSEVAAAITAALPHIATAAEVAAAVAASMPTPATVLQGQIVEFAAGQVPAAYAQVAGPDSVSAGAWEFAWPSYNHGKGVAGAAIFSAAGKLVAMYGADTTYLQVLNDDYTPNGAAITVPSSYYSYHRLVPLANGKLLRIGGYGGYNIYSSSVVQTFDPVTRSITNLQSKPTAISHVHISVEAGNGAVFLFNGTQVDRFQNNVWTENIATVPAAVITAEKLPSGKLLIVCANTQYVYDPATPTQFTAVAVPITVSASTVAGPTAGGARVIDQRANINGTTNTLVAYEFSEASASFVTLKPYARTPSNLSVGFRSFLTKLKDGGLLLCGDNSAGLDAVVHRVSYTPVGVVKAVKL